MNKLLQWIREREVFKPPLSSPEGVSTVGKSRVIYFTLFGLERGERRRERHRRRVCELSTKSMYIISKFPPKKRKTQWNDRRKLFINTLLALHQNGLIRNRNRTNIPECSCICVLYLTKKCEMQPEFHSCLWRQAVSESVLSQAVEPNLQNTV